MELERRSDSGAQRATAEASAVTTGLQHHWEPHRAIDVPETGGGSIAAAEGGIHRVGGAGGGALNRLHRSMYLSKLLFSSSCRKNQHV